MRNFTDDKHEHVRNFGIQNNIQGDEDDDVDDDDDDNDDDDDE